MERELLTSVMVLFLEPRLRGISMHTALQLCRAWQKATASPAAAGPSDAWDLVAITVQQGWHQERIIMALLAIAISASVLCPATLRSVLTDFLCAKLGDERHPIFLTLLLHMLHAALCSSAPSGPAFVHDSICLVFEKTVETALKNGADVGHLRAHAKRAAERLIGHEDLKCKVLALEERLGS